MLEKQKSEIFSGADLVALQVPANKALPAHDFSLAG
jgi:hypothetical protein